MLWVSNFDQSFSLDDDELWVPTEKTQTDSLYINAHIVNLQVSLGFQKTFNTVPLKIDGTEAFIRDRLIWSTIDVFSWEKTSLSNLVWIRWNKFVVSWDEFVTEENSESSGMRAGEL